MNAFNNLKKQLLKIEQHVPFIPNFSDPSNIGKIILISFWICVIYTCTQIDSSHQFYEKFGNTIIKFIPYLVLNLFILIIISSFLKKIKTTYSIFLVIFNNLLCVYIINSILYQSFFYFFINFENLIIQFYVSFGVVFLFLIYFDWKEKNIDPSHHLAKLTFLQAKMKPHFLFNTINSIVSLIKRDPENAKKMLLNLSELLRVSIKEDDITQLYLLKEEINLCEKYLAIEKIRLGDRLQVEINIEPEVMASKVPKLFLQPLIENAILHGIQNLEDGGTISIKINKKISQKIAIEIKNPVSFNQKKNKQSNKIAVENIKTRLNLYFDYSVVFNASEIDKSYSVYIEIPFTV